MMKWLWSKTLSTVGGRGSALLCIGLLGSLGCAPKRPTGFFPVTYWCSPPAEDARYAEVAECGFTLALNGDLDLAHKYGLKCIVHDKRVQAAVANPGPQTDAGLDAALRDCADHPAFRGLYLKDEPSAAKFADLAHVNQYLLAREPNCVPFINLFPTYASQEQLGTKTYEEHVDRFMRQVKPKVLSYDHYALMEDGTERKDYFRNMEIIRSAGLKYDTPYWYIFLITPHFAYRDPSEGDLRWQVYTALAYGYKGLVYFTYWHVNDKRFGEAIIGRDGDKTKRYYLAMRINAELKAIGPILATVRSTDVYHTTLGRPEGTRGPNARSLVRETEGGGLVVGELAGPKGRRYLLLTNASPHEDVTPKVVFAQSVEGIEELARGYVQPEKIALDGTPPSAKLHFPAGDGRLFEVKVSGP